MNNLNSNSLNMDNLEGEILITESSNQPAIKTSPSNNTIWGRLIILILMIKENIINKFRIY